MTMSSHQIAGTTEKSWDRYHIALNPLLWWTSGGHRCMGGCVLGTSQPSFKPESKARPNCFA